MTETYETKRKIFEIMRARMTQERASFMSQWRDLADYILPNRPRFFVTSANRGERKNQKIIDSTATIAARTLRSGMMSGVTSPARPWFRLTTPDPNLSEFGAVKQWLSVVSQRMSTALLKSNLYNTLPLVYGDLGIFGTAAMYCEEDETSGEVSRFSCWPIGSYMISANSKGQVDTTVREFRMTIAQLIEDFGIKDKKGKIENEENFSPLVLECYRESKLQEWIDVVHIIRPNPDFDSLALESKYKRYSSCYYEQGSSSSRGGSNYLDESYDRYLRESGYDLFPVLVPRWEVSGEDFYGTESPGMCAIGDVKALQTLHRRMAQAIEKSIHPPMNADSSLRTAKLSILPGDINYIMGQNGQAGFVPAYQLNPRINEMMLYIQEHQKRIQRTLFEDLFLMLAQSDRRQITAREIDERHEEKLLALGPVLEQLNQDLLDPLIDIVFSHMLNQGLIPEPPEEIEGQALKVEYISIMAQAQKLISIGGIERFAGFASQVAQVNPEALDKIDTDQILDVYADITSIPPGIVRSDDQVAAIRQQRAKQQQQAQMAAMMQQGADTAKTLSETDTEGENALSSLLKQGNAGALVPA